MLNSRQIRDLERECRGKVPPGIFGALLGINEDIRSMRQQIMELAGALVTLSDIAEKLNVLMDNPTIKRGALTNLERMSAVAARAKQLGVSVGSEPTLTGEADEV